jgi:hypothetical protein
MLSSSDDGQYQFETTCVGSDYESISEMNDRAVEISLATFRRKIGTPAFRDLATSLGYDRHFPISKDWHIWCGRSTYRGMFCVFLRWSRIEHIYVR